MYNEFGTKHYKEKWFCTTKTLYNEKILIGRLHQYFLIYFETFSVPTADTLFLLISSILTLESEHSIRFLYQHFLSRIAEKSRNVFYYAGSYAKGDYSRFMNTIVRIVYIFVVIHYEATCEFKHPLYIIMAFGAMEWFGVPKNAFRKVIE